MGKLKLWQLVGILAVVGVAAFIMTEPPQTPPRKKPPVKRTVAKKTGNNEIVFTKEDYDAKFERLGAKPRNSFEPLVVSLKGGGGKGGLLPNEIPAEFSGDNTKWTYTGTAIVDGVPMALVENPTTGEGEFIKVGQSWKKAVVRKITPTSLVLGGPNGKARTLDLMKDPVGGADQLLNTGLKPLAPNVNDNIRTPGFGVPNPGRRIAQNDLTGPITQEEE